MKEMILIQLKTKELNVTAQIVHKRVSYISIRAFFQ